MHFALNKATDFISKPWHTYLESGRDITVCANTVKDCAESIIKLHLKKKKQQKKKTKKRGDRCYFFVFSLVYLLWGSLVYNIYHHVFQRIC